MHTPVDNVEERFIFRTRGRRRTLKAPFNLHCSSWMGDDTPCLPAPARHQWWWE